MATTSKALARDLAIHNDVAEIRNSIDHPIIDSDGHFLEFMPMVEEILNDMGASAVVDWITGAKSSAARGRGYLPARAYWANPTENTYDRMTAILPELLYRRLDQLGIDFSVLYPTFGLKFPTVVEQEVRLATSRAFNTYFARVFDGYEDRLAPAALIPMFTPEEALAELDYVVGTLGLKTIVMSALVPREIEHNGARLWWLDTIGHGSLYDYDPVWKRCAELGVSPSFHAIGFGWGTRASATNYVYNHLGNFGAAQEATCRSLLMGGVPRRFPDLHFTFLEGGVAWAAQLFADTIGHYEKRNSEAVHAYNPARIDLPLALELFDEFGATAFAGRRDVFAGEIRNFIQAGAGETNTDDFAESRITGVDDIVDIFTRQFSFGCEADDALIALAFNREIIPGGVHLNAMFSSDNGHWDVPDMSRVLHEAWELIDRDLIDAEQFRTFAFGNAVRALTAANPAFFEGTVLASKVDGEISNHRRPQPS